MSDDSLSTSLLTVPILASSNEQLAGGDGGRIIYVDPVSGEERSLKVA